MSPERNRAAQFPSCCGVERNVSTVEPLPGTGMLPIFNSVRQSVTEACLARGCHLSGLLKHTFFLPSHYGNRGNFLLQSAGHLKFWGAASKKLV